MKLFLIPIHTGRFGYGSVNWQEGVGARSETKAILNGKTLLSGTD